MMAMPIKTMKLLIKFVVKELFKQPTMGTSKLFRETKSAAAVLFISGSSNFNFTVGWHVPEYSKGRATLNHQPQNQISLKHQDTYPVILY